MNKQELLLLERAWVAEIGEALDNTLGIVQTKSKIAEALAKDGYLEPAEYALPGRMPITIKGYRLTHLGRMTYCASCAEEDGKEPT